LATFTYIDIDNNSNIIGVNSDNETSWNGNKIIWGSDTGLVFKIGYIAIRENGVVKIRFYVNTKQHGNANYGNKLTVKINGEQVYNSMIYFNNSWYNVDIRKHDNLCGSSSTKKCGVLWNPAHIRELRQADYDTYKRWYWGDKLEFSSSEPIINISASLTGLDLKDGSDSAENTVAKVSGTIQNWTPVSAGIPTILDNGNNTFSLTWNDAISGENNEVVEQKCFYRIGYSGTAIEVFDQNKPIELPTTPADQDSVTICAYTIATGTFGGDVYSGIQYKDIKHYVRPNNAPADIGKPFITTTAENRVNLTTKHPWLLWFPIGEAANDSSPIVGYRLQLKVYDGVSDDGVSAYFAGTVKDNTSIDTNTSETTHYCDVADNMLDGVYLGAPDPHKEWLWHYILIDPTTIKVNNQPLKGGMQAAMLVKPYTQKGEKSKLAANDYMTTDKTLVHGSGTVRVKKDDSTDSWDECQVWVKLEDGTDSWVEAEGIYVKATSNNIDDWTEIQ
jgi:hypothetical protein